MVGGATGWKGAVAGRAPGWMARLVGWPGGGPVCGGLMIALRQGICAGMGMVDRVVNRMAGLQAIAWPPERR